MFEHCGWHQRRQRRRRRTHAVALVYYKPHGSGELKRTIKSGKIHKGDNSEKRIRLF